MRKRDYYQCENKDADQLCSNCTANQRFCFHYNNSTYTQNFKSVAAQAGLCPTWSETRKTGFLASRLILNISLGHVSG